MQETKIVWERDWRCRCVVTEFIPQAYMQLCALALHAKLLKNNKATFDDAQSSDFCFILDFKASICLSSACCLIFSCFSCSFFFFSSSSCCSANFFARIFSRISNGGSKVTEMIQLGEVLCSVILQVLLKPQL